MAVRLQPNEEQALCQLREALGRAVALVDLRLFGSRARGEGAPDSDIDVMIEVEKYTPVIDSTIGDLIFQINLENDTFISPTIFSREDLEKGPLSESPLFKAIKKEGVRL